MRLYTHAHTHTSRTGGGGGGLWQEHDFCSSGSVHTMGTGPWSKPEVGS